MNRARRLRTAPVACFVTMLAACAVTPLTNHIDVGEDAIVIGAGEGLDGNTDLFAASAAGGSFIPLTFTPAEERLPRLSSDGTMVAFLRSRTEGGVTSWTVVALDLKTGAERTARLPASAGEPEQLGWDPNGAGVVLHAGGYFMMDTRTGAAELRQLPENAVALADSAVQELLGQPPIGVIVQCAGGGSCIAARTGEITSLGPGVTGAVRWGADSVGYFAATGFEVRPLAGGRSRRPEWRAAPRGLRSISYHPGRQTTVTGAASGVR